jgi:hypothetical protein
LDAALRRFFRDAMADMLAIEGADGFGPAATVAEGAQLASYWPIEIAVMDLNLHGHRADDLVVELARKGIRSFPQSRVGGR